MDFVGFPHLLAGVAAAVMGVGVLLQEPARERNRLFAILCGSLAAWNLGYYALGDTGDDFWWRVAFAVGPCAAAPLSLNFALVLAGVPRKQRHVYTLPAYAVAGSFWLLVWTPLYRDARAWAAISVTVLGGMLAVALGIVLRHTRKLPSGPERRALRLVFWGGVIAAVGGVSDLLPVGDRRVVDVGPLALLIFLLIVCAVIVRHRFLDVDVFLVRAVALLIGATTVAMIFYGVTHLVPGGVGFPVLLVTSVVVLAGSVPLGRMVLTRTGTMLTPADPLAVALVGIGRRLPRATSAAEIWAILEQGRSVVPGDVRLDVYLRQGDRQGYRLVLCSGGRGDVDRSPVAEDAALPRLLGQEMLPATRRFLEHEQREGRAGRDQVAAAALREFGRRDLQLVVPLQRDRELSGWVAVAGGVSERYLTAEVITAFQAVGNQVAGSLERIEAIEAAKRAKALAAVGQLAAGLAHEVRNPVAAIHGASQALGPEATESQRREMLEVIEQESARLGRFVGEFLDYARPESPRFGSVDPADLVRRGIRGHRLAGGGLTINLRVTDGTLPVRADPDQLQRVVDNLIRNAWEAAEAGGRLDIEIYPDGKRTTMRFQDDGPGIAPADAARLFEPFFTTKSGGTGLGLALAHRIVQHHDGEVQVEGGPDVGACFTVGLPVWREEDA